MCGCTCPFCVYSVCVCTYHVWRSGWFLCLQCVCVCVHATLCGGQDNLCVYSVCGGGMPRCVEVRKALLCVQCVCGNMCLAVWRSGRLCYVYNVCVGTHAMLCGDQRVVCGAGSLSHLHMGCTDGT